MIREELFKKQVKNFFKYDKEDAHKYWGETLPSLKTLLELKEKGKLITEECGHRFKNGICDESCDCAPCTWPKLVVLRPKIQETYTREEVVDLCHKAYLEGSQYKDTGTTFSEWKENNI